MDDPADNGQAVGGGTYGHSSTGFPLQTALLFVVDEARILGSHNSIQVP